jgi:hypothetical protein
MPAVALLPPRSSAAAVRPRLLARPTPVPLAALRPAEPNCIRRPPRARSLSRRQKHRARASVGTEGSEATACWPPQHEHVLVRAGRGRSGAGASPPRPHGHTTYAPRDVEPSVVCRDGLTAQIGIHCRVISARPAIRSRVPSRHVTSRQMQRRNKGSFG